MLADTGATLSLVDKLVLKRLEGVEETLRPYEGLRPVLTKSVSGDLKNGVETETVKTMVEGRRDRPAEIVEAPKPEIPPDKGMEADFSDSALSDEQKRLFQDELNVLRDMFLESSKRPGRTELLKFGVEGSACRRRGERGASTRTSSFSRGGCPEWNRSVPFRSG
ncbi:hypothetical protein PF004_g31403 [Phytophthora fragariae]|uniref:Peptidase A2 domain-containing protein n=1 Tax=Phytophthora fragariae TaxID=53985 RepID=A0A6G0M9V4_9STRA|nr:hypothetical protein PF004_g31403 [Phytophthora fragariae]